MRDPWFKIVAVWDDNGPSLGDIAKSVCDEYGLTISMLRQQSNKPLRNKARRVFSIRVRERRPDLSSPQVGRFLRVDSSTVRRYWRQAA